jgi:glycosyltransferase involved in cell wall biosynthesis
MQICILTHRIGVNFGSGIERYGYEIYERLKSRHDVKLVESAESGLPQYIADFTYVPFKAIANGSKIVHALTPREALALPFLRKSVVTYHDFIAFTGYHSEGSNFLTKRYYGFLWKAASGAKHITANSEQTKAELMRAFGLPPEKISVVNLGVDGRFKPLPRAGKDDATKIIGYLSSMVRRKRVDKAIEFFKMFQDRYGACAKMEIYGKTEFKNLQVIDPFDVIRKLGVKDARVFGFVDDASIVETYNRFDVMLYTSDYEGFGLPVVEAVSCGVPVVVRRGARITPEVKELCVEVDEHDAADTIHKILFNDGFRRKAVKSGLEKVKRFSWENCVDGLERVYQNL